MRWWWLLPIFLVSSDTTVDYMYRLHMAGVTWSIFATRQAQYWGSTAADRFADANSLASRVASWTSLYEASQDCLIAVAAAHGYATDLIKNGSTLDWETTVQHVKYQCSEMGTCRDLNTTQTDACTLINRAGLTHLYRWRC